MKKALKLIAIVLISVLNISCSKANKEIAMSRAPEKKTQTQEGKETETHKELKSGADISKEISSIKIKTLKNKTKDLEDLMGSDKTLFMIIKPGCIFCESLITILNSTKPEIKAKQIMVLDSAHTDFEAFKKKAESGKNIDADWIYDYENAFHDRLGARSFPRLIVVDSKGTVIENQIGLVVPKDQDQLTGKPMAEVLQILSLETVKWMRGL